VRSGSPDETYALTVSESQHRGVEIVVENIPNPDDTQEGVKDAVMDTDLILCPNVHNCLHCAHPCIVKSHLPPLNNCFGDDWWNTLTVVLQGEMVLV